MNITAKCITVQSSDIDSNSTCASGLCEELAKDLKINNIKKKRMKQIITLLAGWPGSIPTPVVAAADQ